MERNRDGRRMASAAAATNGMSRRRQQRSSSLRDSPEEDGGGGGGGGGAMAEMQETTGTATATAAIARLRDRGPSKKDRDRDRLSRSKRRRGERLIHGSNRGGGDEGEDSTEDSLDEDEEDDDEDSSAAASAAALAATTATGGGGGGPVRMLPPNPPIPSTSSSSISNQHHHHNHHQQNHHQQNHHHNRHKSFPPPKLMRTAPPPPPPVLKAADEMIGVAIPRKARSASVKRTHESWNPSGGVGGEQNQQIHRQASTSPARPSSTTASASAAAPSSSSPAPISPPSNTSSLKKKMKSLGGGGGGGLKQRPPKMAKQSSSSVQDDIEIEVAEVLYGLMRQSHCPSKQDFAPQKPDWKDTNGGSSSDVKSRISSPTSNSPVLLAQNSNSSTAPSTALAPKRKRPRPAKPEEESPVNYDAKSKIGIDQSAKAEVSSPKSKADSTTREDGGVSSEVAVLVSAAVAVPQMDPESGKPESESKVDLKALNEELVSKDEVQVQLPQKESSTCKIEANLEDTAVIAVMKSTSIGVEVEIERNEKFKIDLMVPLPSKSSPDRDCAADFVPDPKPATPDVEMEKKLDAKDEERVERKIKQDIEDAPSVEKKVEAAGVEDLDLQKKRGDDVRVHLDLEQDLDRGLGNGSEAKQPQMENQQQSKTAVRTESKLDKSARFASLPLPMTLAGWPGGLPPLGFAGQVPPIPGVMPMDGNSGSSNVIQQPHFLPSQRRHKCATHFHIARTIYCHQQFARMNPFFAASAGSAAVYGTKPPYNLNILPQTENAIIGSPLPGIFPFSNSMPDKNKVAASLSGHNVKDKGSITANFMDGAQTKQLVLQQASQPANASNLMHAPAYIFPLSQQQAVAASQSMPGKSASSINATSMMMASSPASGAQGKNSMATAASMSFSYPNLPNEAQYLAVLQNNGYPFPVPSHVGAPPPYRGGNAQAVPFYNGSFYSSQMLHPSQLQQQPPHSQQQPGEQGHQNMSTSSGSSSSQKHQQQRVHAGGANNGGAGNAHIAPKNRSQPPHNQSIPLPHNVRQLEAEAAGEESPSTADSRVPHLHKNIYCQNFTLPLHPQNFALMSPAALAGSVSGNGGDKPQQSQQQHGMKGGVELIPSQAFAMSFAFNGGAPAIAPGIDFSSMAQNHAIFQSLPEAVRREYQIAAASQAAHQNKTHQIAEEGKTGESSAQDEEKKAKEAKGHPNVGQTLVFSRPDSSEHPSSLAVLGNPVIDGSSRTLNLISPVNGSRPSSSGISSVSSTATIPVGTLPQQQQQQLFIQLQKQQQQQQQQQQHQQQLQQPQLQQQLAASSVPRPKQSGATNANVYPDRLPVSSAMSAKLPNNISVFPQALMQGGNPAQNPQWKQSARGMTSSTSSLAPANSSLKNLSQHQIRSQQGLSQISFGVSPKSATSQHGQPLPTSNPSPSPPMAVGSPASASKSAGGSPRTTTSSGNKVGQVGPSPSLPSQQPSKTSQSGPSSKSSPVGGRSVPSILGNAHVTTTTSSGSKAQPQQQMQQQQFQKQSLQQAQLFFSNPYMQAQSLQSSAAATSSISAGFYNQRRPPEQQQQQHQVTSSAASTGLLGPPLALTSAADPTKAIPVSAGANNMKGVLPLHTAQFTAHTAGGNSHPLMSTPFSYMHSVPAVPVKPTEHKKPAA